MVYEYMNGFKCKTTMAIGITTTRGVNEMGMVMMMEIKRLTMGDDALASNDPCSSKDDALCKFPLQIPSGGEVSASWGVSE